MRSLYHFRGLARQRLTVPMYWGRALHLSPSDQPVFPNPWAKQLVKPLIPSPRLKIKITAWSVTPSYGWTSEKDREEPPNHSCECLWAPSPAVHSALALFGMGMPLQDPSDCCYRTSIILWRLDESLLRTVCGTLLFGGTHQKSSNLCYKKLHTDLPTQTPQTPLSLTGIPLRTCPNFTQTPKKYIPKFHPQTPRLHPSIIPNDPHS